MTQATAPAPAVLSVRGLTVSYPGAPHRVRAALDVSFDLFPGRTVALVGESGSGKSTVALALMRLLQEPPARIDGGSATLAIPGAPAVDLLADARAVRAVRGRRIAMIFQEPMTSLNPVMTIGDQIVEAIRLHQGGGRRAARDLAAAALQRVGIADAAARLRRYPHEFSGGMRQRALIAMALACRPAVLIADEPTTALDATVQLQVFELLRSLQKSEGLSVLLVTHALGLLDRYADEVCVMQGGRVFERGPTFDVLRSPLHPYTRSLLAAAPSIRTAGPPGGTPESKDPVAIRPLRGGADGSGLGMGAGSGEGDWRLVEAEPGRWVAVWGPGGPGSVIER